MKATLTFSNRKAAVEFAKKWTARKLAGHDISATRPDGSVEVKIYNVTEEDKNWIDSTINQ